VAVALFLAVTAWAAFRRGLNERLLFTLVLVSGLILYPGSLEHYSVLLLLPVLMVWSRPDLVPGRRIAIGAVVVAMYAMNGLWYGGVFWSYLLVWAAAV